MASSRILLVFSLVASVVSATTLATEFVVGDGAGWTKGFDYKTWAKDKEFRVGDNLVFRYQAKRHNVFKVNGSEFKDCKVPPPNQALTSGNDIIPLATPGEKWYICGFPGHCQVGQKLAIFVLPQIAEPPYMGIAPTPAPGSDMTSN